MRALTAGDLKAARNNAGEWLITPDAVDDWMSMRSPDRTRPVITNDTPGHVQSDTADITKALSEELNSARVEVARLTAEAEGLRARLTDTQTDRDRLAQLLERALEARSTGFFAWLFGR